MHTIYLPRFMVIKHPLDSGHCELASLAHSPSDSVWACGPSQRHCKRFMSGANVHGVPEPFVYDDDTTEWWEPEAPRGDLRTASPLSAEQAERWRADGFLALDGSALWPTEMMVRAKAEAEAYFPRGGEEPAHGAEYLGGGADLPKDAQPVDRKGRPWPGYLHRTAVVWPSMPFMHLEDPALSSDMALNHIALHPPVLSAVAQLLSTTVADLRLNQCAVRARYGPPVASPGAAAAVPDLGDQAFHVDYGNNSLVVPPRASPDAVAAILYYADVEEAGAPTHAAKALPGELTSWDEPNSAFIPPNTMTHLNSRERIQRLYAEERPVRHKVGTILLYRLVSRSRDAESHFHSVTIDDSLARTLRCASWVGCVASRHAAAPRENAGDPPPDVAQGGG